MTTATHLTLGSPHTQGSLALFPILGPGLSGSHLTLHEARRRGLSIEPAPGGAVAVHNGCPLPVLLLPGDPLGLDRRIAAHPMLVDPQATVMLATATHAPAQAAIELMRRPLRGQVGALVEIGAHPVALTFVSRPGVYAELFPKLMSSFAAAAREGEGVAPDPSRAQAFLDGALWAPRRPTEDQRIQLIDAPALSGTAVEIEQELVALWASRPPPVSKAG